MTTISDLIVTRAEMLDFRPTESDDRAALMAALAAARAVAEEDDEEPSQGLSVQRSIAVDPLTCAPFGAWRAEFRANMMLTIWSESGDYLAQSDDEIANEVISGWDEDWDEVQVNGGAHVDAAPVYFCSRAELADGESDG
jgi:hypothetical protein